MVFCAGGGHLGGYLGSSMQYHSIKYKNTSLLILDFILMYIYVLNCFLVEPEYVESHFSKIPENVRYHQNTPPTFQAFKNCN